MTEVAEHHRKLTNQEWLDVLKRSVQQPEIDGIRFPAFPPDSLQSSTVGSANEHALTEAFVFYDEMTNRAEKLGIPIDLDSRILDFGCAWGRYLRYFWRDVLSKNLVGVDVNPEVINLSTQLRVPGVLRHIDPRGTLPFETASFSHAFSYSVFSHLPEEMSKHWIAEIARVVKPSGLFMFTVEPPRFIDFVETIPDDTDSAWHQGLKNALGDPKTAKEKTAKGEFVYLPTSGGKYLPAEVYGDAVISETYARREWSEMFDIIDYIDEPSKFWQAVVVAQLR